MSLKPQREHLWLRQLIGEWTYESVLQEPGKGPARSEGSERVRPIGAYWVVAEGQGEMPGYGRATTLMTLGFDARKRRYVGSWVGSVMSCLWIYEGTVDATGRKLTLYAEGPDPLRDGTLAKYRDVIEIKSEAHRVLTSAVMHEDGTWGELLRTDYRRWE